MTEHITFCHIKDHATLLIQGPDARKFLQGQVTCDIDELKINDALSNSVLGAHCTHKGRVVFSFRALALDEQTIALQVPSDMADIASAALQKYIVFSKAKINNVTEDYQLLGIQSKNIEHHINPFFNTEGKTPTPNTAIINESGILLALDQQRFELWLTNDQANAFKAQHPKLNILESNYWHLSKIHAGVAEITSSTSGLFTPHAINYHSLETAVSFQKGCYTGQEVVARMHYLGKLKRQMFTFEIALTIIEGSPIPQAGDPVYTPEKAQSVGEVVAVGQDSETLHLLVSAVTKHVEKNAIFLDLEAKRQLNLIT